MPEDNTTTSSAIVAREIHIRTLQHKIVIFLIALMLFLCRPLLSGSRNNYTAARWAYQNAINMRQDKEKQHQIVLDDLWLLQKVSSDSQKNSIIQCYNTNCQNLPEALRIEPKKSIFKAYLQLQQSMETKFTIDQKQVLKYLNEFLTKSSSDGSINGEIQAISFGGEQPADGWVVRIPISMTMKFQNKQWLLGFLRNIEQLISPTYPMLGIVQSVTYDIVKSDTTQDVIVSMDIYMLQ
jgi:hypothetical protein